MDSPRDDNGATYRRGNARPLRPAFEVKGINKE
jgi:hypothetical protein